MQTIILILEFIHIILGVFGIPIYRMSRGGKLFSNFLLCWGLYIFWAIFWCILLPLICSIILPLILEHPNKHVFSLFPEATGVPGIIFIGWIPSIIVCSIAYIVIYTIKKRKRLT